MEARKIFEAVVAEYPQPLAKACSDYLETGHRDPWEEWAVLSRDVLTATLHYLSHIALAELAASERKVPELLYWIEKLLKRPLTGQYLGFLRETTRYFQDHELSGSIPELFDFLRRSELEKTLTEEGKGLLELLVAYRNQWAHGKVSRDAVAEKSVAEVRRLTALLLAELAFLKRYPLENEAGAPLMGVAVPKEAGVDEASTIRLRGAASLRPLMLKVRQGQIALLEQVDFNRLRLAYRSPAGSHKFSRKDLEKKEAGRVIEELRGIYDKVRSLQGQMERLDYGQFCERAALVTDGTLADYQQIGKYDPRTYVPRSEWAGDDGLLAGFLRSDKTLLALDGAQGSGKSAQLAFIADQCRRENCPVLFVNAQRFSFFEVAYRSENPFPRHFATLLNVTRLVDSADTLTARKGQGTQPTVIIIDGINEIDGWDGKWNRFRAMEELLHWVVTMAHPRLKIICGFRLEAYQEYGYLKTTDLPPGLEAVAWQAESDTDWTVRLAPFALSDARRLFERLQERPEDGLSPSFSWDEMVVQMGDSLEVFAANPLLFRIFLRAHHGQAVVLGHEPEVLFRSYIDQLTGREAARRRPWWLKLFAFLRNGGVTPRERLLADVVKVASATGGMGFQVEDLNEKKNRRLLRALEDPRESGFETLCDAQVLSEESFQLRDAQGEEQGKRRVSYVAEALERVLREVQERTDRLHSFSSMFGMVAMALLMLAGAIFLMGKQLEMAYAQKAQEGQMEAPFRAAAQLDYAALFDRTLGSYVSATIEMTATVFGLLLCFLVLHEGFKRYAYLRRGVLALSVHHRIWGKFLAILFRPVTAGVLPLLAAFFFYALVVPAGLGPEWVHAFDRKVAAVFYFDLFSLLLGLLVFYLLGVLFTVYRPGVVPNCMMFQRACLGYPRRLVRYILEDYLRVFGPEENRRQWRIKWIPTLKALLLTYALTGLVFLFAVFVNGNPEATAAQDSNWFRIFQLGQRSAYTVSNTWAILVPVILILPLFSAALLFSMPSVRDLMIRAREQLQRPRNFAPYRMQLLALSYYYGFALLGLGTLLVCGFWLSAQQERSTAAEQAAVRELREQLPDEELFTQGYVLDLAQLQRSIPVDRISALAHLSELYLPRNFVGTIDVSRFKDLQVLSGPADAFTGWPGLDPLYRTDPNGKEGNRLRTLVLFDPGSMLDAEFEGILSTERLEIHGQCTNLDALGDSFPALVTLSIDARHASLVSAAAIGERKNLVIELRGETSPQLDWLTSEHADCIIRLMTPIGQKSQNLQYLERLFMPVDGFDPEILKECVALRWLHFEMPETPSTEWLQALRRVIDSELPRLETLEFSKKLASGPLGRTPEFSRYKPHYLAKGRDDMRQLLDLMASEPSALFEED